MGIIIQNVSVQFEIRYTIDYLFSVRYVIQSVK